ncbi:MAG: ABC transporter substrate-binding protein [Chloroflexota bacterium]|nr:ABC transporter substrate-binding protein [Chloroflexota bacterium]
MTRPPLARVLRLSAVWLVAASASLLLVACPGDDTEPDGGPTPTATASPTATPDDGTSGVTSESILFGQSAAFEGPAAELGRSMRLGILAAFQEANEAGGVNGRRLELISMNDSYEPEAAIANTRQLIEEDQVFALIGAVGTPTSRSTTPIAAEAGVPNIAPFTGAAFLRDPSWGNIINLRASYNQETEEMVDRLIRDLDITSVGIMYQDDSYGRAGYGGVVAALDRRGLGPSSIGIYPRNTTAVKTALLDLSEGNPEAVVQIGAYEPVAELILWAREVDWEPVFLNVSFVGSNALARALGFRGVGVFVTQVVPFPWDDTQPVVAAYQRALKAHDPEAEPGFVSLEGYIAGRLAIIGLERCGAEVDRSCFLDSILGAEELDIDGFPLSFGEGDNQGSDAVFMTVIGFDGRYYQVKTLRGVATPE